METCSGLSKAAASALVSSSDNLALTVLYAPYSLDSGTDFPQVDVPGSWYISVIFGDKTGAKQVEGGTCVETRSGPKKAAASALPSSSGDQIAHAPHGDLAAAAGGKSVFSTDRNQREARNLPVNGGRRVFPPMKED